MIADMVLRAAYIVLITILVTGPSLAHWTGPLPIGAPDKAWWDSLHASGNNNVPCCDIADGQKVENVDWDTAGPGGRYRVHLQGKWIIVPNSAVVTAPNLFGMAVVWPYQDSTGKTQIRCFMPGSGA